MTDSLFDDDESAEGEEVEPKPLPRKLREMYEKEKAKREALEKTVDGLNKRVRNSELSKSLTSRGLPEQAVDLFPADVEVTDETVNQWVEKYGALFGSQKPVETPTGVPPTPNTPTPLSAPQGASQGLPEGVSQMADTLNQMNNVAGSGTPANGAKNYAQAIFNPNFVDEVPFDDFKDWLRSEGAKI